MPPLQANTAVQLYRNAVGELHARHEELGQIAALLSDVADTIAEDGPTLAVGMQLLAAIGNEWPTLDDLRAKLLVAAEAQNAVQRAWEAMTQGERDTIIGSSAGKVRKLGV